MISIRRYPPAVYVAALAMLLFGCVSDGGLRDLVQSGHYDEASALYERNVGLYGGERSRYAADLRILAHALNERLVPDVKTALGDVAAMRWPVPRAEWPAMRRRLMGAHGALDRYQAHGLLSVGNYRAPAATQLKVRLGILAARMKRDAPALFAAYPHFTEPRFFDVYPAEIAARAFFDAHFSVLHDRLARARPDELERFLSLYPAGRDLSPDLAHALGNLHLRAEARTLSGSDDRVPIEAFLEALGRSRMAGFAPDRRSGFELAFVHTYQPEGRRDGQRFELEAEIDLPAIGVRAAPYDAVRAAHEADYALIARVAETRVSRHVVVVEQIPSRYRAGTERRANPRLADAAETLVEARTHYRSIDARARLRDGLRPTAGQLQAAREKIAVAAAAMRRLPPYVDVAVMRDYAYERRTVAVVKHMRLVYYVLDRRTRRFSRGEIVLTRDRRFDVVEGLHPDDPDRAAALAGIAKAEDIVSWEAAPFPVRLSAIAAHFLERRGPIARLSGAAAVRRALIRGG